MPLPAFGTNKQMMPTLPATAVANRLNHPPMRFGNGGAKVVQIGGGMIAKDGLNPAHDNTPRMSWFIRRRESSLP